MQGTWLHHSNRKACLLFFAGWGMDPQPFRLLDPGDLDVHMVWDYRHDQGLEVRRFAGYETLHLVAWSMGVYMSGHLAADFVARLDTAVAINGTLKPIHDRYGIPRAAYQTMIQRLDGRQVRDFYARMFMPGEKDRELFFAHQPRRTSRDLRQELVALQEHYRAHGPGRDIFTVHIASSRDTIFPVRNQRRFWGRHNCRLIRAGHFPFYTKKTWAWWAGLPESPGTSTPGINDGSEPAEQ